MRRSARFLIFLYCAIFCAPAICQDSGQQRDKFVLLTTPYNQRPLTLFRGQLQANTGYKFAVRSQAYDADGAKVYLKDNGTGSVYHYYYVRLRYGITNFMETGIETNFLRRGIRETSTTVNSSSFSNVESVTVNTLTESKGMGDIFMYATLRMPVRFRWIDVSARGGMYLPSAKYRTQQPTNNVTTSSVASTTYTTVNLHYNFRNGYGVPVYLVAASAKVNYRKLTAESEWTFRTPASEGHNIRWEETMAEKAFSYYDKSYAYLLSNIITFDASLHFQATGWFNISMNSSFYRTKGGWTEYWGNKYSNPEKRLVNLEPGFELQVSPSLTVYQVAGFPLGGKNIDSPFYLFTTISFNMFPFLK